MGRGLVLKQIRECSKCEHYRCFGVLWAGNEPQESRYVEATGITGGKLLIGRGMQQVDSVQIYAWEDELDGEF